MTRRDHAVEIQRSYYATTAEQYDEMHVAEADEHYFALAFLDGAIDFLQAKSVLDLGAGTGRAVFHLKSKHARLKVVGLEPVAELRAIGHRKGLAPDELIDGDATRLPFSDGSVDIVCAFALLHHLPRPELAIAEMLRVARSAVFISDANNFGQGRPWVRALKQAINATGLWPLANYVKTRGKGYSITEGDGLAYSYSVFNNYRQIRRACRSVHVVNTMAAGINPYRTAGHLALLGLK